MPALNFQSRFVPRIEIGLRNPDDPRAKTHTIRAPRKDGRDTKPGDKLYLYCGLRTKSAYKIEVRAGEPPPLCTRVESIVIAYPPGTLRGPHVFIGPKVMPTPRALALLYARPERYGLTRLTPDEAAALAIRDGFKSLDEMLTFWEGRLPFYGYIIHWRRV